MRSVGVQGDDLIVRLALVQANVFDEPISDDPGLPALDRRDSETKLVTREGHSFSF